MNYINAAKFL